MFKYKYHYSIIGIREGIAFVYGDSENDARIKARLDMIFYSDSVDFIIDSVNQL